MTATVLADQPLYIVDAFTQTRLSGNAAAVMPLAAWPEDAVMQAVAAENAQSETAFFVPAAEGGYDIRWFTPTVEVPLCGHATLAAAWVIFNRLDPAAQTIVFHTREVGDVTVVRGPDGRSVMSFPSFTRLVRTVPEGIDRVLGARALEVQRMSEGDLLVVLDSPARVRGLTPLLDRIGTLGTKAVCVTAEGPDPLTGTGDYVCRYFLPERGIPEDPVTGSIQRVLAPFWSRRLGKADLVARQVSPRGGTLYCRVSGDRTEVSGDAVLYLEGKVTV